MFIYFIYLQFIFLSVKRHLMNQHLSTDPSQYLDVLNKYMIHDSSAKIKGQLKVDVILEINNLKSIKFLGQKVANLIFMNYNFRTNFANDNE